MRKDLIRLFRYRWFVFSLAASVYFFGYFYRLSSAAMSQAFVKEWSVTGTALGVMSSLYFFFYAAVQLPVGVLCDVIGQKKVITLGTIIMISGSLLSYIAPTFTILAVGRALIGTGAGFLFLPLGKFIRYWFREEEFTTVLSLNVSISNVSAVLASAPLLTLMRLVGWRNIFLLISMILLSLVILIARFVEDSPEKMGFPSIEQNKPETTIEKTNNKSNIIRGISTWFHNPTFFIIAILMTIEYGTLMGFQGLWAVPFLSDVYKMNQSTIGILVLFMAFGMIVGGVSAGYTSDKIFKGRRKINIVIASISYTITWCLLLFVVTSQMHNFFLLGFLFFMISFSNSFVTMPILGLVADLSPKEIYGTIAGVSNIFPFIGAVFFQGIMGVILDASKPIIKNGVKIFPLEGYIWTFTLCVVAVFISILLSLFIKEPGFTDLTKNNLI
jgi:sugar phosphate permease